VHDKDMKGDEAHLMNRANSQKLSSRVAKAGSVEVVNQTITGGSEMLVKILM